MEGIFTEKPNGANLLTNCEQIDLTLKLSPCVQNAEEEWLSRSSSMAREKSKSTVANGAQEGPFVPCLDRSCSLPAEAEKGLIRFGDLQTMRRVKAGKRLLVEKQRRVAAAAAEAENFLAVSPPGGQPLACANDKLKVLGNHSEGSLHEDLAYTVGGASSNVQTSPKQENSSLLSPKAIVKEMPLQRPADTKLERPAKKLKPVNHCLKGDDAMDILRQMPSVTTTGEGPSGKRIEGLLYRYRSGEVCIVCVCHGSFLSPAEFVMHAGGKEVANPMKHIIVCSNSF